MYTHGPQSAFESETFSKDLSFHVEQPVGSMSISPCGRDVVLASKEGLHVIDLDSPYSPPRYLPHRTPWEVADVQWSPFAARDSWVISTSNQKALVWNLSMKSWQDSVEFVLHGHSRAITDINFSAHHPDVLATCAVDSFVHCWDLRVPARPAVSFSDWFAGATQVKWSRQVSHVIASSHDKYLRIWDDRMGASPVRSIEAHDTKIYGIDWNRQEPDRIVTCSLDRSIKFWNFNDPSDVPERVINTSFPTWRARHTPFGWGLLAMPQRGNCDLHLYDRRPIEGKHDSGAVPEVARFHGHKGQVKEFLWRPRGTIVDDVDHREFQLVTWGTDRELRLHRMNPETLSAVGYKRAATHISTLNVTRRGAKYKTFRDEATNDLFNELYEAEHESSSTVTQSFPWRSRRSTNVGMSKVAILHPQGWLQGINGPTRIGMHGKTSARRLVNPIDWMKNVKSTSWNPESLGEEISQVGEKFAKVSFESVDVRRRKAVISMDAPWCTNNTGGTIFLKIDIRFPTTYPAEAGAIFKVQKTAAMTDELAEKLSTELRTIAEAYVARKRGCLEVVLRYLLREQEMEQIIVWNMSESESLESFRIVDDGDLNLAGDLSSDEDDVGIENFRGSSGLDTSSAILNTNVMMPVPNSCGAQWADNGKLICFFHAKSKEPTSFIGLLGNKPADSDRSDKVFEGFGRLRTDFPAAKSALRTVTSAEDQGSDFSDDSSLSSSSSSTSSDNIVLFPPQGFTRNAWHPGRGNLHRSRSTDYSAPSAFGTSVAGPEVGSGQNVVAIRDISELMPSRRELATEYIVFGPGLDVCNYNAEVAMRHGYGDLAQLWHLIALILQEKVPLERIYNPQGSLDIVTIARSAAKTVRRQGRAAMLGYEGKKKKYKLDVPGRVRWGESALGGRHLIPALFDYFERIGDLQMLAMLSCVLTETKTRSTDLAKHDSSSQPPPSPVAQASLPGFAIEYHPSMEVARSIVDKAATMSFAWAKSTANKWDASRLAVAETAGYNDLTTPYPTGTTPKLARQLSRGSSERGRLVRPSSGDVRDINASQLVASSYAPPVTLSASPDEPRSSTRSNSNLTFSIPRSSLSTLARSFSHSPPNIGSGSERTTRSSPVGSFIAHHMSTGGRNAASIFRGTSRAQHESGAQTIGVRRTARPLPVSAMLGRPQSISFDVEALESIRSAGGSGSATKSSGSTRDLLQTKVAPQMSTKRKVKIRSTLHNQNKFDDDGYANVPLLDPDMDWKYRAYRTRYAHLLGVWDLQIQKAEILKFGGLSDESSTSSRSPAVDPSVEEDKAALETFLRGKVSRKKKPEPKRGLEIRRRCVQCRCELTAIEKNGVPVAWSCMDCGAASRKHSTRTPCAICRISISGLMVPCLKCGHATCFGCQRTWLARANKTTEEDLEAEETYDRIEGMEKPCATGCGCVCSSHEWVSIPTLTSSEDGYKGQEQPERHVYQSTVHGLAALRRTPESAPTPASSAESALGAFLTLSSRGHSASDRDSLRPSAATARQSHNRHSMTPDSSTSTDFDSYTSSSFSSWAERGTVSAGLRAPLTRAAILREQASDATIRKRSASESRSSRLGSKQ